MASLRMKTRMNRARALPWLALGPLLGSSCQSAKKEDENQVVYLVQHGQYGLALEHAEKLARENPDNPRARILLRDARIAYVLDQGRELVFLGRMEEGLELFEEALVLDPENPTVQDWITKTRAQLASHWLDRAAELTGPDQLAEAGEAYEKVLEYAPDNWQGKLGLARVLLLTNYRAGQSKTYFDEGLRSFRGMLLDQARREFQVSREYKENEPAVTRGIQTDRMIALERLAQAKGLEADGLYFAARNEYRLVLLIETENSEAKAGLDRMDREVRVSRSISEADMDMRRGNFDGAEEALDETANLTEAQADEVTRMQAALEDARLEEMYIKALNLATDYRYPEAVAAFDELIAVAPDYQDAVAQKATFEEFIRLADEFYAKALDAKDDAEAEKYLDYINRVVWPEYKDVEQRLAEIRARRAAETTEEQEAGEDGE